MKALLSNPFLSNHSAAEHWALFTSLTCGVLLCAALFMELVLGLAPCPLCMMQRVWVVMVGLIAWLGAIHNPRFGIYPLLGCLAAIIGGGFSIRQLYLQSLPADQVPACGPDLAYMLDAFPLGEILSAMTSGTGDCATVSAALFGISIPGWTLIGFIILLFSNIQQIRTASR